MARKSNPAAGAAASRNTSKRRTPPEPATTTLAKRPKRQSTLNSAPTKSDYFSHELSGDETKDDDSAAESSGFEASELSSPSNEDEDIESDVSKEEEEEEEEDEEDVKPSKRSRVSAATKSKQVRSGGKESTKVAESSKSELWRPGVPTGLEPGTQVVIKKPKARDPGKVPYTENTIHPNTMLFLQDLAANNDRDWLKMHDVDYRTSQKDFSSFVEALTQKVIEADETVPELPVKDIVFRIYRDVRFSKNPTPYKTNFSAAWSRTGRKGPYAAYYMQIKPNGGSLVAGGLWMPEANALALLRRDIDRRPQRIKQVLRDVNIRKEFLGGVADNNSNVVKKLVAHNAESALKTKPKGYDPDHKDIDLLRLKSFTLSKSLEDREVLGLGGLTRIAELIATLVPFISYLNSIVMPDESSDDDEDEADEDDNEDDGFVEVGE